MFDTCMCICTCKVYRSEPDWNSRCWN